MERAFLIGAIVLVGALMLGYRRQVGALVRDFFGAETSPYNLAVFRVIVFLGIITTISVEHSVLFSKLPRELIYPPRFGWRFVLHDLPMTPELVAAAGAALYLFAVCGLVGFYSRFSALMTAVLMLYVVGVGQFFGKVSHWHHMLWFAALLAASPCGAVLSVDAVRNAWRRADAGIVGALPPSRSYALPIRVAWILMGIIYFFPGLWKLWYSGFDWAFSDNLRNMMYGMWFNYQRLPVVRIDAYPALLQVGGLATIVFELTFIFFIFHPLTRIVAGLQGVTFHLITRLFLYIPFGSLQAMYLTFVDWPRALRWLARPLTKQPCVVLFDGGCGICRRTIATLNTLDPIGAVAYVAAQDTAQRHMLGLGRFSEAELMEDMHVVAGARHWKGFDGYRVLLRRFPLLWPLLPLMYVPPVPQIGRRIYRRVADSQACSIDSRKRALKPLDLRFAISGFFAPLAIVLVAGNGFAGLMLESQGWPFACYPPFRRIVPEPQGGSLRLAVVDEAGTENEVDLQPIIYAMWEGKVMLLLHRIANEPDDEVRVEKWAALLRFFRDEFGKQLEGEYLRLYRTVNRTSPDAWDAPPLEHKLVNEIELAARTGS